MLRLLSMLLAAAALLLGARALSSIDSGQASTPNTVAAQSPADPTPSAVDAGEAAEAQSCGGECHGDGCFCPLRHHAKHADEPPSAAPMPET